MLHKKWIVWKEELEEEEKVFQTFFLSFLHGIGLCFDQGRKSTNYPFPTFPLLISTQKCQRLQKQSGKEKNKSFFISGLAKRGGQAKALALPENDPTQKEEVKNAFDPRRESRRRWWWEKKKKGALLLEEFANGAYIVP